MLYAYDMAGRKHKFLSMIDHASSYHQVIRVSGQTGDILEKVFMNHWIQPFGFPKTITIDLEIGIQDAFARLGDWFHIDLRTSAGQAHWQSGFTERHGQWWKEIFKHVTEEHSATADEMDLVAAAACFAKNSLRRRAGWAPVHIVFGKGPRDEDDLIDREVDSRRTIVQNTDDAYHRRESIRVAAKIAFLKIRTKDKIRRGSLQRTRVSPEDLPKGSMVLFWRKDKNHKKGAWRGPGVVIGRQQTNFWVSSGGRCYLCAPEHLRLASPEELGELFTMEAAKDDLNRLLERSPDDEETYQDEDNGEQDGADQDNDDIGALFEPYEQEDDDANVDPDEEMAPSFRTATQIPRDSEEQGGGQTAPTERDTSASVNAKRGQRRR